jgi:phage tail-like protein
VVMAEQIQPPQAEFPFILPRGLVDAQGNLHREGGVNDFVHHLPRQTTHSNLVLTHGLTDISTLWSWYYNVTQGIVQRKNGTIMLLDRRQTPIMWWNFRNALPVRWSGPQLQAGGDVVAVEVIELAHEGLTKPLIGQALSAARGVAQLAGQPDIG